MSYPTFTGRSPKVKPLRNTGSVVDQIHEAGWEGELFRTADRYPESVVFLNPAVRAEKGNRPRHLFTRESTWAHHWSGADNRIVRFTVDGSVLSDPKPIEYPRLHPKENWEDPRVIEVGNDTFLSVANWFPMLAPQTVGQKISLLTETDEIASEWSPTFGRNGQNPLWNTGMEKNWAWFPDEDEGALNFVYSINPHVVVSTKGTSIVNHWESAFETAWRHGDLRGGTNPVLIGDEYLAFFHSSLPWKTIPIYGLRRRYFMGAYTFSAKPPYQVLRITPEPLLIGSEHGPKIPGAPAVVFPCGLIKESDSTLYLTYGINDCACGWARMGVDEILRKTVAC